MADLPSSFWGGWIALLTITSLAGLTWLLFSIYFNKTGSADHDKIIWDESLNEGEHPAPMWWFWLILSLLVISVIYLLLYPGLGSYSGAIQWSQKGRIDESFASFIDEYETNSKAMLQMSMEELQDNSNIMRSANGIFDRNCAMCHGEFGLGQANTFPNLMDGEWQWGASITQIEQTIRLGRNASMPAWSNRLSDEEILQVVNFLQDLGNSNNIQNNNPGKAIYDQLCFGCHGSNGTGNVILGAPNLADTIWLYGKTDRALKETISNGRSGLMPGFQDRLNDVEIRLLIAWLTR